MGTMVDRVIITTSNYCIQMFNLYNFLTTLFPLTSNSRGHGEVGGELPRG